MSTRTPAAGIRMPARLLRPERRMRAPIVMLHGLGVSAASLEHDAPRAVSGAVSAFLGSGDHGPRMSRPQADAPADQ